MATTFAATDRLQAGNHQAGNAPQTSAVSTSKTRGKTRSKTRSKLAIFFGDLLEDVREPPLQAAHLAKHDMFREHINAMSIRYFALILLLIAASLPVLAYLIGYQAL